MGLAESHELFTRRLVEINGTVHEVLEYKPVSQERAVELLAALPVQELGPFITRLAHFLTIVVRSVLHEADKSANQDTLQRRLHAAWQLNEMMHGLTLQIRAVMFGGHAYSPEQFWESLYSKARRGGFEREFSQNAVAPCLWGSMSKYQN